MADTLTFDDVQVGDSWTSSCRTITDADVANFAWLTGDFNPLHMDGAFAASTPFGRPIAHGLFGLSLVAGLGSEAPLMHTAALVRLGEWKFLRPVYFGDTVHVQTSLLEKRPRGNRHGTIVWLRRLINQDGLVVQEGTFETMVFTRLAQERMLAQRAQNLTAETPITISAATVDQGAVS